MNDSIPAMCSKLRELLEESVKRNFSDGILLSGGLDTSILTAIATRYSSLKAFTVAFEEAPAPDVKYATLIAHRFGLKHLVTYFGEHELYDAIRNVVKVMKSFDPMEIRNSVAIYVGLSAMKEHGISMAMTGDGCDELFGGYSFLFNLKKTQLDLELQKLWDVMQFSSIPLANSLGLEARLPYLDPEFKSYAMTLDSRHKVRNDGGKIWGKWIVRKAFEGLLPDEIVWRVKTPIEYGSGTTVLTRLFGSKIPDAEFDEKRRKYLDKDKVIIQDKEQLFYYEVYTSVLGVPHPSDLNGRICPRCNSNVPAKAVHCQVCGAYPI